MSTTQAPTVTDVMADYHFRVRRYVLVTALVLGVVFIAAIAATALPIVGVIPVAVAGYLVALRKSLSGADPVMLSPRALYLAGGPQGRKVLLTTLVMVAIASVVGLGWLATLIAMFPFSVVAKMAKRAIAQNQGDLLRAVNNIAVALGVTDGVINEGIEHGTIVGWNSPDDPTQGFGMAHPPAKVAVALADRSAIEERLMAIDGGAWELDPDSDHEVIRFVPASDATREARRGYIESGGVFMGSADDMIEGDGFRGTLVLNDEDLL